MRLDGQMGQEGLHLASAHLPGMSLAVEEDEATNPIDIGLLGADGVVQQPELLPDLVEEFHRSLRRAFQEVRHRSYFPGIPLTTDHSVDIVQSVTDDSSLCTSVQLFRDCDWC
jgi:hypothetical protein